MEKLRGSGVQLSESVVSQHHQGTIKGLPEVPQTSHGIEGFDGESESGFSIMPIGVSLLDS